MKEYDIIGALTKIKEAALEGRTLEAWNDHEPDTFYRYDVILSEFVWRSNKSSWRSWYVMELPDGWTTDEIFAVWHVREVDE